MKELLSESGVLNKFFSSKKLAGYSNSQNLREQCIFLLLRTVNKIEKYIISKMCLI
jgi:hypothetical protein